MNITQLNHALVSARAEAVTARRKRLLTLAQDCRVNANLYGRIGGHQMAAKLTIEACGYEQLARDLTNEVWI